MESERNKWSMRCTDDKVILYCGECGEECDDDAEVTTNKRKDGKIIIQRIVCQKCLNQENIG